MKQKWVKLSNTVIFYTEWVQWLLNYPPQSIIFKYIFPSYKYKQAAAQQPIQTHVIAQYVHLFIRIVGIYDK